MEERCGDKKLHVVINHMNVPDEAEGLHPNQRKESEGYPEGEPSR